MKINGIKKSFGNKNVLKDISLEIKNGECIGLLGGNGSGKSTLLNILSGVLKADGGTFEYEGADLLKDAKKRSDIIGYVPQNVPLFDELTAFDNLKLWYDINDLNRSLKLGVLAMLGIDAFINIPVKKMSGGMKKRLSIGCSMAHNPPVLLLDEASAALDIVCKERISNYIKEYKNNGGIVILATHDMQELEVCDRLFILKDGVLEPYEFDGNIHRLAGKL